MNELIIMIVLFALGWGIADYRIRVKKRKQQLASDLRKIRADLSVATGALISDKFR